MGPACVHRLRNRPPGVARGHIRIPEECSSTDCVTEHDGRWSWPPRSWLVGFCLRFCLRWFCVLSFRYVCDRAWPFFRYVAIASGSTQPYAALQPYTLSLHAFLTQPLSSLDARSAPGVCRQRCVAIALPTSIHSVRMRQKKLQASVLQDASCGFAEIFNRVGNKPLSMGYFTLDGADPIPFGH